MDDPSATRAVSAVQLAGCVPSWNTLRSLQGTGLYKIRSSVITQSTRYIRMRSHAAQLSYSKSIHFSFSISLTIIYALTRSCIACNRLLPEVTYPKSAWRQVKSCSVGYAVQSLQGRKCTVIGNRKRTRIRMGKRRSI